MFTLQMFGASAGCVAVSCSRIGSRNGKGSARVYLLERWRWVIS
jgi:hypothetical protein